MNPQTEIKIARDIAEEKKEIHHIEENLSLMKDKLLEKVPSHFSRRDMVNSFIGALILGLTFILRGSTVSTAVSLNPLRIMIIIVATLVILMAEIYYIGYSRVRNKNQRKFGQFMTKRLFTLYFITLVVSFVLIYLLNVNNNVVVESLSDIFKIVVLMSFPCAIGTAIPSLLKQY